MKVSKIAIAFILSGCSMNFISDSQFDKLYNQSKIYKFSNNHCKDDETKFCDVKGNFLNGIYMSIDSLNIKNMTTDSIKQGHITFRFFNNGQETKSMTFYNKKLQSIDENGIYKKFFENGKLFHEGISSGNDIYSFKEYYKNGKLAVNYTDNNEYHYDENGKILYQYDISKQKYIDKDGNLLNTTIKVKCYDDLNRICKVVSFKDGEKNGMEVDINFAGNPFYFTRNIAFSISEYNNGKLVSDNQVALEDSFKRSPDNKFGYDFDNYSIEFSFNYNDNGDKKISHVYCFYNQDNRFESKYFKGENAEQLYKEFKDNPTKNPCPKF